jgi:hypothetical protein
VDLLLAWGFSVGSRGRKAIVQLDRNHVGLWASMALPGGRYMNIEATSRVRVDAGQINVAVLDFQLGQLRPPNWLSNGVLRHVVQLIEEDPELGPVVESIESLSIQPRAVQVSARPHAVSGELRTLVARLGSAQDTAVSTRVYVEHLLAVADGLPQGDERFQGFVRAAFELARRRSEDGDAVHENRAAIYALGIVLGHPRVERLVGTVTDDRLRRAAEQRRGTVTIRGRADWVRHFCVSAALALWSTQGASDAAGLLKEELDAGRGGSGFSFADLLADRAGTVLGIAATASDQTARGVQRRLEGDWDMRAVFPPAEDLPEGLSDAELQRRYGGVGGIGYRRMVEEIERRLEGTIGKDVHQDKSS